VPPNVGSDDLCCLKSDELFTKCKRNVYTQLSTQVKLTRSQTP